MLKYANSDIVFQEFPDEVTLAINITGCPNGCPGCHSSYLQRDCGERLTLQSVEDMLRPYAGGVTCIGLMGGDAHPDEVMALARQIRQHYEGRIKVGWYSGRQNPPANFQAEVFDYVKFGPYVEKYGPLKSRTTNQRLYRIDRGAQMVDITARFWQR